MKWAIRVTFANGDEAWLRHGSRIGAGLIVTFASRRTADINADFLRQGLDGSDSVTVVKHYKQLASAPVIPPRASGEP